MYCSREYNFTSRFNQQYEKSTSNIWFHFSEYKIIGITYTAHYPYTCAHISLDLIPWSKAPLYETSSLLLYGELFMVFFEPSVGLLGLLYLMLALFRAKVGYMHFCSTCLRLFSSLLSSYDLEETDLSLCVKLSMTLNLAARLW